MAKSPIPLIDLDAGASPQELARQISDAVKGVGFLHLKGFGISAEDVKRAFAISKELFDSPVAERAACPHDTVGNGHVAFGKTRLSESAGAGDLKENFSFGRFQPPFTETQQRLPPVLVRHKAELLEFHRKCYAATCTLLDAFSIALNLPETFFRDRHTLGACAATLINYPPVTSSAATSGDPTVSRASAHNDWGSVTLLFQEENGPPGLEIYLPKIGSETEGIWHSAPIVPDTVLVNVGLALEKWTGGQFKATLHRVVVHGMPDGSFLGRKSIAFFVQPEDSVVFNTIQPDGRIVATEGSLTSKQFFVERMAATVAASA
ncbi:hypothetical protein RQP46_001169 [Phenoliferia psychrophenolica]